MRAGRALEGGPGAGRRAGAGVGGGGCVRALFCCELSRSACGRHSTNGWSGTPRADGARYGSASALRPEAAKALGHAKEHFVEVVEVRVFVDDALVAEDRGPPGLAGLLVEVAGVELGPGEALPALADAIAGLLDVGRLRVDVEQALVLGEGLLGGSLVPVGAVLLVEVRLARPGTARSRTWGARGRGSGSRGTRRWRGCSCAAPPSWKWLSARPRRAAGPCWLCGKPSTIRLKCWRADSQFFLA